MPILSSIEEAITRLGDGEFHEFCDAFMASLGYRSKLPTGRVVGRAAPKPGTPDTAYLTDEGWLFIECTIQRAGIKRKVETDARKDLDESKTGIAVGDIIGIYYFSAVAELGMSDLDNVKREVEEEGTSFYFYGPSAMASIIYARFPHLANDYLGIKIGAREVTDLQGFARHYGDYSNGIPITNRFCLREREVSELEVMLREKRVVLVSGDSGVGKTKLVLHVLNGMNEASGDNVVCIRATPNVDVCDIDRVLRDSGESILFVDDANSLASLDSLFELVNRDDAVSLVMTVRAYAAGQVKNSASRILHAEAVERDFAELNLSPLNKSDIRTMVKESFGISDYAALERIASLARGNPRLMAMACRVFTETGSLAAIADASSLYDSYFSQVESACFADELETAIVGLVAALSPVEVDAFIDDCAWAFEKLGITPQYVVSAFQRFHRNEILDMEQELAVAFRNQSLKTFVLKRAFFDHGLVDLSDFITNVYPKHPHKVVQLLNDVSDVFRSEGIVEKARRSVLGSWDCFESECHDCFPQFRLAFCVLRPSASLAYVEDRLSALLPEDYELSSDDFETKRIGPSGDDLVSILSQMAATEYAGTAVDLLLDYFEKRPSIAPTIVRTLYDSYCFCQVDAQLSFLLVPDVIEKVRELALRDQSTNSLWLFAELAKRLLNPNYEHAEFAGGRDVEFLSGVVEISPAVEKWRELLFQSLIEVQKSACARGSYDARIIDGVAYSYAHMGGIRRIERQSLIAFDFAHFVAYAELFFDCHTAYGSVMTYHLDSFFSRGSKDLRSDVLGAWRVSAFSEEIVLLDGLSIHRLDKGLSERDTERIEAFKAYGLGASTESLQRLGEVLNALTVMANPQDSRRYCSNYSVALKAVLLAGNEELFMQGCRELFEGRINLGQASHSLARRFAECAGIDNAYTEIESSCAFDGRLAWLFEALCTIPSEELIDKHAEWLLELGRRVTSEPGVTFFMPVDELVGFREACPDVLVDFMELFDYGSRGDSGRVASLVSIPLFERCGDEDVWDSVCGLVGDLRLVKDMYLNALHFGSMIDYEGHCFLQLLECGVLSIGELLADLNSPDSSSRYYDDLANCFYAMWDTESYDQYATEAMNWLAECGYPFLHRDLFQLFCPDSDKRQLRRDAWLLRYVKENYIDSTRMDFCFWMLSNHMGDDARVQYYELFVELNDSLEDFKQLSLFPSSISGHPSFVPAHERRIAFLTLLKQHIIGKGSIAHCKYLDGLIESEHKSIECERVRDFLDW